MPIRAPVKSKWLLAGLARACECVIICGPDLEAAESKQSPQTALEVAGAAKPDERARADGVYNISLRLALAAAADSGNND